MGNIVTETVTRGTSAVLGELELITRELYTYSRVLQLLMTMHVLYVRIT